jgi:hypothetical protein
MNHFEQLAIAAAVSAAMLGASVAEAHVSYNSGPQSGANSQFPNTTNASFAVWTGGAPTGYQGKMQVDWVAFVHNDSNPNASYFVSTADAVAEGAPDAYVLQSINNKWNPANSWGNALDYGLIDLHADANLTITVAADASLDSTFTPAFTLWSGWDQGTGNKHGAWNADPFNPGNRGATGITYAGHSAATTAGGSTTYTFYNLPAGEYSLWIGGNGTSNISTGQQYTATIAAAPVPIPAAAWMFGSALAGIGVMGRRKNLGETA